MATSAAAALEERRNDRLKNQERNREKLLDAHRNLVKQLTATKKHSPGKRHQKNNLVHRLLSFSEWFLHVPEDVDTSWFFMPCPQGKRCIVQASEGLTQAFSKRGQPITCFKSSLPGGGSNGAGKTTILDCVFSEANYTFYVLDVIHWGDLPMIDTNADFRQFWLNSRLEEIASLPFDDFQFRSMQTHECTVSKLEEFLTDFPFFESNQPKVDGVLFFHREAHYTSGSTPLIGWLKPFMIPEVFGASLSIADGYSSDKPGNYVSLEDFTAMFNEKHEQRRKVKVKNVEMADLSDDEKYEQMQRDMLVAVEMEEDMTENENMAELEDGI